MSSPRCTVRCLLAAAALVLAVVPARAGDVAATVKAGRLQLHGDDSCQLILMQQDLPAGSLRLMPQPGTTVNGAPDELLLDGITSAVRVRFDAGNNVLTLRDVTVPALRMEGGPGVEVLDLIDADADGPIRLDLGPGLGLVRLGWARIGGSLRIRGGAAPLQVSLDAVDVQGPLRVAGQGALDLALDRYSHVAGRLLARAGGGLVLSVAGSSAVAGRVSARAGGAPCFVALAGGAVLGQDLRVRSKAIHNSLTFAGARVVGNVAWRAPGGNGTLILNPGTVGGRLSYRSGPDWDDVALSFGASVGKHLRLQLDDGPNQVRLEDGAVVEGAFRLRGGEHGEQVLASDVVLGSVSVDLGEGDNAFALLSSQVAQGLKLKAGDGDDAVDLSGTTVGGPQAIQLGGGSNTLVP